MIRALWPLSVDSLKSMAKDTKTQVDIGLMSRSEAHDKINCISAVIMAKELENMNGENHGTKI